MQPSSSSWSVGRFLKTLAYFDVVPWCRYFRRWSGQPMEQVSVEASDRPQGKILFDFVALTPDQFQATWGALDDVVMGGVSESRLQLTAGGACFTGLVSTANSGGFASVRTRNFDPPLDLTAYQGIRLRLQGDGQRYKFLLRSDAGWDQVAYAFSFDTIAQEWQEITIPFAACTAVFRARTLPDAPPLNPGRICSLQLMLSKFEYDGALNPRFSPGPFNLTVETIWAYA